MMTTDQSNDYNATIDFLYRHLPMFEKIGPSAFKKDLTNIQKLCEALGNPQLQVQSIHIAGTNGKGSVSHMLSSILIEAGYKTGLYISPHYKDYRERIRIQGKYISKKFIVAFVERIKPLIEEIRPSFFEITVAMAFEYFAHKKIDIAVIETGLGGRLDSTNIILPALSIITNISMDHQNMLGNTLSAIAGEKAGIMKAGVPCLIGEYQREPARIFTWRANELKIPLRYADRHSKTDRNRTGDQFTFLEKNNPKVKWVIKCKPLGPYQEKNINTVIQAALRLSSLGFLIQKKHILSGIAHLDRHAPLIGRWQVIRTKPLVLLDAAHNIAGITYLCAAIKKLSYQTLHILFGTVRDKEVGPILALLPRDAIYYFVQANLPRAMNAEELATKASDYKLGGKTYHRVKDGYKAALQNAGVGDMVLVTGSIFVVGEVV